MQILTLLLIAREPQDIIVLLSEESSYKIHTVKDGNEALAWLRLNPVPDVILLEVHAASPDGAETLVRLREAGADSSVLMLSSGKDDPGRVVRALRLGAHDYVSRHNAAELKSVIADLAERRMLEGQPRSVEFETLQDGSVFVAASAAMMALRNNLEQVGRTDFPVLCLGESGAGKEVIARLVHSLSSRSNRRFEKVNCAAVPGDLLESELFGYERGAFTGAVRSKPGRFEMCHKGTMFLDEIGEMPPAVQAKLLHVLQDKEFHRLGGAARIRVDVRIIAATNVDVHQAIAAKRFREDLYYRLSTFVFHLPPLRDRREDIPVLLRHFLHRHAADCGSQARAISQLAINYCLGHTWPGNVRELENFAKRYLVLGDAAMKDHRWRSSDATGRPPAFEPDTLSLKPKIKGMKEEAEAGAIWNALEQTRWNRKEAAALLQISYKSLLMKIRRYSLDYRGTGVAPDLTELQAQWRRSVIAGEGVGASQAKDVASRG